MPHERPGGANGAQERPGSGGSQRGEAISVTALSLNNRIGQPVSTYYIVPFNSPDDKARRQKLIDACKLPGYGG